SFLLTGTLIPLSIVSRLTGINVFSAYLSLGIPFVGAAILAFLCASGMSYAVLRAEQQCPSTTHSPI
ncbi:MAG TPA: hypothetical protein VGR95_22785, partial [Thermoanaerobaculia bacterium]|nr:hypothetical protein [Thermoanaerobaculia bacterium]